MDKEGWPCRKEIMMDQTMSLIKAVQGKGNKNTERQFDTRDQLMNKRLDTAGALMGSLFCHIWNKYIEDRKKFIFNVKNKLNNSVYGNDKSKEMIETIIAQWISGKNNGAVIGFNGPPGVGKTTLAKKGISECLVDDDNNTRPFAFISLGGSSAGSTLEGHNYTYVGSTWGKIVDVLIYNYQ